MLEYRTNDVDRSRKPDFFVPGEVIGDENNVEYQGYTAQMVDDFRIANALRVRWQDSGTPITQITLRFDLIVRAPSHRRGATNVDPQLVEDIRNRGGDIYELIEDPGD